MSMLFDVYTVYISASQSPRSFFVLLPADKGIGVDDIIALENQFFRTRNDLGHLVNFNKLTNKIIAEECYCLQLLTTSEFLLIRGNYEQP